MEGAPYTDGACLVQRGGAGDTGPSTMSEPAPVPPPVPSPEPEPAPVALLAITSCPSCGEQVRGRFCPRCGQSHAEVRVPFWKWLGDYLQDTFHLESNLARSLGTLLRRPGALTVTYLEGQRSTHVRPFRLYLTASFIYFLALSLLPPKDLIEVNVGPEASRGTKVGLDQPLVEVWVDTEAPAAVERLREDTPFKRKLNRFVAKGREEAREQALRTVSSTMPKAMFVLVPVFALLLGLLYRKTGRFYAEHFLFALHFHAFAFLALSMGLVLVRLLGLGSSPLIQLTIVTYLFLSLRRVYGQSRVRTVFKTTLLYGGYSLILLSTVLGAMFARIYFAD